MRPLIPLGLSLVLNAFVGAHQAPPPPTEPPAPPKHESRAPAPEGEHAGKNRGKKMRPAHERIPLGERPRRDKSFKRMLERFDSNKDGKIDTEEAKRMRQIIERERRHQRARLDSFFDTDRDGELSPAERKAMREFQKKAHHLNKPLDIKFFDVNKDGKLDEEERKKYRQAFKARQAELQKLRKQFKTAQKKNEKKQKPSVDKIHPLRSHEQKGKKHKQPPQKQP